MDQHEPPHAGRRATSATGVVWLWPVFCGPVGLGVGEVALVDQQVYAADLRHVGGLRSAVVSVT